MKLRPLPCFASALVLLLSNPAVACTMAMVENTMLAWARDDDALYFDSYDKLFQLDRWIGGIAALPLGSIPRALTSSFTISPDGRTLAVATASHDASCRGLEPRLTLADVGSGQTLAAMSRPRGHLVVLGWASDSKSLVIGFSDRRGSAIKSAPVQEATRVDRNLQPIESLPPEAFGHLRPDLRMALSFDGWSVLTAHWLKDPRHARGLVAVDLDRQTVRFSADGRRVGYGLQRSAGESVVVIRDAESLERIATMPLTGQRVLGLAFHPTRPYVAVASEEIAVEPRSDASPETRLDLLDYGERETLGRASIGGYRASRLEWSHDGDTLAVGGSLDESTGSPRPWLMELEQLAPGS
ncbi:MAG: WD40 repeat domain-containing protein [Deltaproteobacteria bacterium]|nr:WD40 repeat domain-containing protein [Deltaproteobacteria bacterium]